MNILEKNKELFGKKVSVICTDGRVITGEWTEWWDEEDNAYLADDGLAVCDSILIDQIDCPIEIRILEIKDLQKVVTMLQNEK